MKFLLRTLFLLALLLGSVSAQTVEAWPPDAAKFLGLDPTVTFHWPGQDDQRFYLQIYAGDAQVYAEEVKGTTASVPLRPGPRYRWQVNRIIRREYREVVPTRSFQLSSELVFDYSGRDGKKGKDGGDSRTGSGGDGTSGTDGTSGRDIVVTMTKIPYALEVVIHGGSSTPRFFLLPNTPITIVSRGGRGGDGGNGGSGAQGNFYFVGDGRINTYVPGNGGDGGNGGAGGKGGNVSIVSEGVSAQQLVTVDNPGGEGGRGGAAGAPGFMPAYPNGYIPYPAPPSGFPGRPGFNGEPGRPGVVLSR